LVLKHTSYVATVAFRPDGTTLAAGDYQKILSGL